jgi:predicted nucleotidyltransferase
MDSAINATIKAYAKQVNERYKPKAIYLYGSHVNGTVAEHSDIDIAVIFDSTDKDEYMDIFSGLFSIAAKYDANIEPNLLVDDGEYCKYSFLAEVMETGKPIYV